MKSGLSRELFPGGIQNLEADCWVVVLTTFLNCAIGRCIAQVGTVAVLGCLLPCFVVLMFVSVSNCWWGCWLALKECKIFWNVTEVAEALVLGIIRPPFP